MTAPRLAEDARSLEAMIAVLDENEHFGPDGRLVPVIRIVGSGYFRMSSNGDVREMMGHGMYVRVLTCAEQASFRRALAHDQADVVLMTSGGIGHRVTQVLHQARGNAFAQPIHG